MANPAAGLPLGIPATDPFGAFATTNVGAPTGAPPGVGIVPTPPALTIGDAGPGGPTDVNGSIPANTGALSAPPSSFLSSIGGGAPGNPGAPVGLSGEVGAPPGFPYRKVKRGPGDMMGG